MSLKNMATGNIMFMRDLDGEVVACVRTIPEVLISRWSSIPSGPLHVGWAHRICDQALNGPTNHLTGTVPGAFW